jgi:hypothetical protein
MSEMKYRLLNNWHLMRILRLGIGLMIVVMAVQTKDWIPGLLGSFFLYQALADVGCCGSGGCNTDHKQPNYTAPKDITIEYEEIK